MFQFTPFQLVDSDIIATQRLFLSKVSNNTFPLHSPHRCKSQLGTTSLLAPAYVPLKLRKVNYQGATSILKAKDLPGAGLLPHIQKVYESLAVTNHKCEGSVNHEQRPPWNRIIKNSHSNYYLC